MGPHRRAPAHRIRESVLLALASALLAVAVLVAVLVTVWGAA